MTKRDEFGIAFFLTLFGFAAGYFVCGMDKQPEPTCRVMFENSPGVSYAVIVDLEKEPMCEWRIHEWALEEAKRDHGRGGSYMKIKP